jgi:hypothetical protein
MTLVKLLISLVVAGALAAGGSDQMAKSDVPRVPAEFATACAQRGAEVTVLQVPVTIAHHQCDLRGVVVRYGLVGATVPDRFGESVAAAAVVGSGATPAPPLEMQISVGARTGDVTITGG